MMRRCGAPLPACGSCNGHFSTSAAAGGPRLVTVRAFKRSNPNNPNNRQPSAADLQTRVPLPPLDAAEAAAAQPRIATPPAQAPPQAPYAPRTPNGGGTYQAAPTAPQPRPPLTPQQYQPLPQPPQQQQYQQQQQFAAAPLPPPPAQQQPPPQQQYQQQAAPAPPAAAPPQGGGSYFTTPDPQQGGYMTSSPPLPQQAAGPPPASAAQGGYVVNPPISQQRGGYAAAPPSQVPPPPQQQQQAGGAPYGAAPLPPLPEPLQQQQQQYQQQPGFINTQQQQPQQQQAGFINTRQQQGGFVPRGQQAAPQQVQLPPVAAPQQQQGGYIDGGYVDQGGFINTGANAWRGGYVNTPGRKQQQQQFGGGSAYTDRPWQQTGNNSFPGFADDGWNSSPDTDLLLESLSAWSDGAGLQDAWAEVEDDEPEDDSPKFVNGKRVLVNSEIMAPRVRVQNAAREDMGVMTLTAAQEAAKEMARSITEQSAAAAAMAKKAAEGERESATAVRKSVRARVDVVLINETADPPVVRLVDFSKFKYDAEKTAKQKNKASKGAETKEVRLRPVTEKADYETKVRQAQKFLSKGAKVKLTMTFSGREMRFKDQGKEMMLKLIEELSDVSKMDAPLSLRPSNFNVTLSPLK